METDTPEETTSRRSNKEKLTPKDILVTELSDRASRANTILKEHLTGTLSVEITDLNERYLIDWRSAELSSTKVEGRTSNEADCIISLSSKDLARIATGDINPQIAIVSDKVKLSGKAGLAVYFFNLIAPRT